VTLVVVGDDEKEVSKEDCAGKDQQHIQKTPVLSPERALHKNKTVTVKH
jgi:hypothetical protein